MPAIVCATAIKPSRFARFWQVAPATLNNICTSKSGPILAIFNTLDFKICFAPQRRAFFGHLNLQSGPTLRFFVHFDFEMCFSPQRRALFRHLNFPKVLREWCAFCILTSKRASRRNGVQFFISHVARWLRSRRFSEPISGPSGATNDWKNTVIRTLLLFGAPVSYFLYFFSLLLFSDLVPSSLLFFYSSHLCFPICPYCRKYDS